LKYNNGGVLGFDGGIEARVASSGLRGHYKTWNLNINAKNDNLALAA